MTTLKVEHFDTDASSFKHWTELPLRASGTYMVGDNGKTLAVSTPTGIHYLPMMNVKQYFEVEK